MNYSSADSQIMQDLQKLTDKLALLEDLVNNEEDSTSLQGLMDNPTIGQMYRACRDELPKLLELANSELNEDLMNRIINITERLTAVKNVVEPQKSTPTNFKEQKHFELKQSSDDIKNIFDDLPLLSPKPQTTIKDNGNIFVKQEEFKNNNDLLIDLIKINDKSVLRLLNISDSTITNIKLNGKVVKAKLEPLASYSRIQRDCSVIKVEYNENSKFEFKQLENGIENLLLI